MGNDTQERYGLTWKVTPDMLGVLSTEVLFEATNPARFAAPGWTADEVVVDSVDGQTALRLGLPPNASLGE